MSASTHPAPSTMAERLRVDNEITGPDGDPYEVGADAGVSAERARVAADLKARALRIRGRDPNDGAMIVVAYLETYAGELEGKARPAEEDEHPPTCGYYFAFAEDADAMCDCGLRVRREQAAVREALAWAPESAS